MSTPSAPMARALSTKLGSTRPLHIVRMKRTLGEYLIRAVPARSAARYEHQLQTKPMIFGSKVCSVMVDFSNPRICRNVGKHGVCRLFGVYLLAPALGRKVPGPRRGNRADGPTGFAAAAVTLGVPQDAAISAMICSLLKCAPLMAPAGQAATQVPQPLHIEAGSRG